MNIITKIEQKVKAKEAQRARLRQLEELLVSDFVNDSDLREIEKEIEAIKQSLNIKATKTLDQLDSMLNELDLNPQKIENTKFEYLLDNFIVKNEITMFAAPPASGKSLISVALCNMFLMENTISSVIYFDGDNGAATIKERNIHILKQNWGRKLRYFHESSCSRSQMQQIIKQLQKTDLTDVFVIFDSIKNFMQNGDRDKNKDVSKVMTTLQNLRARGASVLFLHHTNKPQRDLQELTYAGSSAFAEDSGNAFILQKNNYKNTFLFRNMKPRTGELRDTAFIYNPNHTLMQVDFLEAAETEEICEINDAIIEFLEKQSQKPSYSQIMQHLQKQGYSRNRSNQALQNGKNRYWQEEKLSQNNRSVYSIIPQNQKNDKNVNIVEIEYRDKDDNLEKIEQQIIQNMKNTRTSDTSRTSPFYGLFESGTTPVQVRTSANIQNQISMPLI